MSCFAVSKLAGRLKNNKEGSPEATIVNDFSAKNNGKVNKKGNHLPKVEILQEVSQPPVPPPRESSMTPVPPSSPQFHGYYQYNYGYTGGQHQRHMSPHRSCNGSVPPSPALSGCRSPSRQRKTTYSTLEVQSAALGAMKEEMIELATRLTRTTKERDYMEKALNRVQLEKMRMIKERDDQLDNTIARYEERLVELHSVIAELSRQVEEKSRQQINEEDTEDEEDHTVMGGNKDNTAVASRTSTEVDAQAIEAGQRLAEQLEVSGSGTDLCAFLRMSRSTASQSMHNSSTTSLQYLALQEELSDAKERNVQLAARLQQRESDLNEARKDLEEVAKEKEVLREKVTSLEEKLLMAPALSPIKKKGQESSNKDGGSANSKSKVAERKKIKKIEEEQDTDEEGNFAKNHGPVTGSELTSIGVRNSVVVEHLVQELQDRSSMQEFQHSFQSSSPKVSSKKQEPGMMNKRRSAVLESKLQEFEIEMERLSSRIEHLKSQNEVLTLTLTESKNHCDNLTVLIGKYESNHTAQQLVISYLDQIIEVFEVLLNLNEAQDEDKIKAESRAKNLFKSLDALMRPDSGLALPSCLESQNGLGSGAWDDSSGYSQNSSLGSNNSGAGLVSSSIGSFTFHDELQSIHPESKSDEIKLKEWINQLKASRSSVQATLIKDLESHHPEHDLRPIESKTADLEIAVLVQELMAMREEKADLRAQVHLLEKEKKALDLIISSQQAQEHALKTHIQHLQDELENQDSVDSEGSLSLQNKSDEMKSRITELLTTLEKVKRTSELRQQQSEDMISDLKKSNVSLTDALDKSKKKFESRIKHLEQQVLQSLIKGSGDDISSTARPLLNLASDSDSIKSDD